MDAATPSQRSSLDGKIVEHLIGRQVSVLLDNGAHVEAVIPATRKFGCLFGSLIGWKVRIVLRTPPKMARIAELSPPRNFAED